MTITEALEKYMGNGIHYIEINGEMAVIKRIAGNGGQIFYPQKGKPNWTTVVEYDEKGNKIAAWLEYVGKQKIN